MKNLIAFIILASTYSSFAACDGLVKTIDMVDPTDGKTFTIGQKIYRPETQKKVPVVFILPPIVGETILDRKLAAKFCGNGIAAYILNLVKEIPLEQEVPDLKVHDNSYVRAAAGVRTVIAELDKDPALSGKYGILGMSLGGMLAAYVTGSEPRIEASVVVVGAGNVPGVLAYSDQEYVKAQRDARLKLFNLAGQKEYEALLAPLVPNDPLSVAHQVRPKSMYMFIATGDTTVPTKYQQQLRAAIPEPLVYEMGGNHVNGIVKAGTIHAGKITSFFRNMLLD